MTRTARTTGILVLLLAAGLLWMLASRYYGRTSLGSDTHSPTRLFTVARGDLQLGIRTTGSLQPSNYLPVASQVSGKIEWLIDEGTPVKTGDVIARVEDVEYLEQLESAELNLSIVQADLALEKLRKDYTRKEREHRIERARITLQMAELEYELLGEPTAADVRLSELDLELKRLILESNRRENERLVGLAEKGIVDQRQISVARLKLERALVAQAKAALEHKLLLASTPEEDLVVARQRIKRARTALDLAVKKKSRDLNLCDTAISVAQASVNRYLQTIDIQNRRVKNAEVKASSDETIYPRPWGTPSRVGDAIWRGNQLLHIADLNAMTVEALVNQVDWPLIKPGQDVEVILTATPDTKFTGKVIDVGGLANDRYLALGGDVTGVMTFGVRVLINETSPLLRPTYTAYLNIITAEHNDVIFVRRTAVFTDEAGNTFVNVRTAGRSARRPVKLGAQDAVSVIVQEGLEPGEVVEIPRRQ